MITNGVIEHDECRTISKSCWQRLRFTIPRAISQRVLTSTAAGEISAYHTTENISSIYRYIFLHLKIFNKQHTMCDLFFPTFAKSGFYIILFFIGYKLVY